MGPHFESHRYLDGIEVRPGATWTHDPNLQLRFMVGVTCTSVDPDLYRGELRLLGRTVWAGDPLPGFEQAATSARQHLFDRLGELLA